MSQKKTTKFRSIFTTTLYVNLGDVFAPMNVTRNTITRRVTPLLKSDVRQNTHSKITPSSTEYTAYIIEYFAKSFCNGDLSEITTLLQAHVLSDPQSLAVFMVKLKHKYESIAIANYNYITATVIKSDLRTHPSSTKIIFENRYNSRKTSFLFEQIKDKVKISL